jgi:uncharacterized protein YutE (UPF0331/DUF86 family)
VIDKELVIRKITLIAPDLRDLEEIEAGGAESFAGDRVARTLAERYLERAVGRMIDINYHLLTESGYPPPQDYYQSFTELGDKVRILPAEFSRQIASCAGLRNRIAHEYDEIDPDRLFEGLSAAVKDIPVYLQHVLDFMGRDLREK